MTVSTLLTEILKFAEFSFYIPVTLSVLRGGVGATRILLPLAFRHLRAVSRFSPYAHTSSQNSAPPPRTRQLLLNTDTKKTFKSETKILKFQS